MHGRSINRGKKSVLARMFLLVAIATALTLGIYSFADGIVIGSAVVHLIDENKNNPDLVKIVSGYVSEIKKALR